MGIIGMTAAMNIFSIDGHDRIISLQSTLTYRIAGKFRGVPKFVIFVVQFESRN